MFTRARESSQVRVILLPDKPFRVSLLNVTFHNIINIYTVYRYWNILTATAIYVGKFEGDHVDVWQVLLHQT